MAVRGSVGGGTDGTTGRGAGELRVSRAIRWPVLTVAGIVVALVAVAVFLSWQGGSDRQPSTTDATATAGPGATSTPEPAPALIERCPVDDELCEFAAQAEPWIRAGEANRLIAGGTAWDNAADRKRLEDGVVDGLRDVAWAPRLATIGCPVTDSTSCREAFSLTFTTLNRQERTAPGVTHSIVSVVFQRRPGAAPAITGMAVPDGDDRWYSVGGGRSANCSLWPAAAAGGPCPGTEFFAVEVVYPVVKGEPPICPALKLVCETALAAEQAIAKGDFGSVAGGSDAELKAKLESVLGVGTARLIALACPFGNVRAECTGPIAVALTTLNPQDDWTVGGKLVVLRYDWSPEGPRFRDALPVEDADSREAAILGGYASKPCDLAGSVAGSGCAGAFFVRYWSDEPFEVPGAPEAVTLALRPPAPPPTNTTIFTATARCWACDEPDAAIQKHVVDAAGKVTTTTVLEAGKGILEGWGMGQIAYASPDGSVLAVTACLSGYCGALGSGKLETDWRVLWSKDGGTNWSETFRVRTEYLTITSLSATGFIAFATKADTGGGLQTVHVVRAADVRLVEPPPGLPARPDATLLADGVIAWIPLSEDGLVVGGLRGEDGRRLPLALPAGAQYPHFGMLPDGRSWAAWYQSGTKLGVFSATGALETVIDAGEAFRPSLVTADLGIGTLATRGVDGSVPALLDLRTRTVTPLGAPFGETLTGRNRVLAVVGP